MFCSESDDFNKLMNNLNLLDNEDFEDEMNDWEEQKIIIENNCNPIGNNSIITPTELFISTLSANCSSVPNSEDIHINIAALVEQLELNPFKELIHLKSSKNISRKNQSNGNGNCIFYNQITMNINPYYNPNNTINRVTSINIKLFQNGSIGISGMKHIHAEDGKLAIHILLDYIKNMTINIYNIDLSLLNIYNFKNSFMNSDFTFTSSFCINRNKLYDLLKNDGYFVIYKNDAYPAVKLCYYYNESYANNNGICKCNIKCCGKGDGLSNGNCKCITIPIFQSGSVLIFGKCEPTHLLYIYNFITNYLISNSSIIKQLSSKPCKYKTETVKLEIKPNELINILNFKKKILNLK